MIRLSDAIGVSILIHLTYVVSRGIYDEFKTLSRISSMSSIVSRTSLTSIQSIQSIPRIIGIELRNESALKIQRLWLSRKRDKLQYVFID